LYVPKISLSLLTSIPFASALLFCLPAKNPIAAVTAIPKNVQNSALNNIPIIF